MNYTNPLPRVCRAIEKYTEVKAIGFCHGIGSTARVIGEILDRHPDELGIRAAGVNHFHWLLDLRDRASGEDLYPLLRKGLKNHHPDKRNLWKDLFRCFGYLPFPSDDHIGEYLPFMWHAPLDCSQSYRSSDTFARLRYASLGARQSWRRYVHWVSVSRPITAGARNTAVWKSTRFAV